MKNMENKELSGSNENLQNLRIKLLGCIDPDTQQTSFEGVTLRQYNAVAALIKPNNKIKGVCIMYGTGESPTSDISFNDMWQL